MKQPRTIRIVRLMTGVVKSVLSGEKLVLDQNSAKLEELGGIYIKFLQLVVLNLDPHNQSSYKNLLNVYENSQPDNINIHRYLATQLSFEKLSLIKSIENKPFATGSFGQVYKAWLWDDRPVIIKVLRPSVTKYLNYDLRLIGLLSWVYSLFDRQKMLNFRDIFQDFKKTSLNETNYRREAIIARDYYDNFKNHPNLVIPETYLELSTSKVITQDFIRGISLTTLLEKQANNVDVRQYCQTYLQTDLDFMLQVIGRELFSKALIGEVVQTDPHPGNIILLPYNQVALIDFGMATAINVNRQALYELLLQYQQLYSGNLQIENFALASLKCLAPDLYSALAQADVLLNSGSSATILDKLRQTVNDIYEDPDSKPYFSRMFDNRMFMKMLFFGINKGNRFGFSFDLSASSLWKAVQTYFVLVGRFDTQAQSVQTVLAMLNEVQVFADANLDRIIDNQAGRVDPTEALETLSCWFDKMSRNDPWLMNRLASGYIE